jgi:hypothetical protein
VRLVRPGHRLDPDGPAPEHVVASLAELPDLLGVSPCAEVSRARSGCRRTDVSACSTSSTGCQAVPLRAVEDLLAAGRAGRGHDGVGALGLERREQPVATDAIDTS